jgi:hypothetical protein
METIFVSQDLWDVVEVRKMFPGLTIKKKHTKEECEEKSYSIEIYPARCE